MKRRHHLFVPILILIWLCLTNSGQNRLLYAQSEPVTLKTKSRGQPYTFQSASCMFEGLDLGIFKISPEALGFECGYVIVPEQHANPDGPTIRLPVAIRHAANDNAKPDPLFLAQGGPGGSAFEIFSLAVPGTPIADERDLVIFNQRGTIHAQPELICTELREATPELLALPPDEGEQKWQELLSYCYQRLQAEGINASAYNSLENAADIEAIRQVLGYDEFNFYGVSYGSLLGLHLMRDYPEHLRSVILDSVVPTNLNFISHTAENENRIYDELFQFCANHPSCAVNYPDLEERFLTIVDQLNNNPTMLQITNPNTGEQVEAYLDGDILLDVIYLALYLSDSYAIFPKIVADLETEDYTFVKMIWPLIVFDYTFSEGMYYSVICAEEADFDPRQVKVEGLRSQIAATATDDLQSYLDLCAAWPVNLLPANVDEPVVSDVPALLLSGHFDPITPPAFAATAAKSLKHAYNVVDPLSSHGVAFNHVCINHIIQDFLNTPNVEPDTTCLNRLNPATIVPPDAISLPLLEKVADLDPAFILQTTIAAFLLLGVLSAFIIWPVVFVVTVLLNKKSTLTVQQKRLRWISRLLVLGFGFLAIVFVTGLTSFVAHALLFESSYLSVFSISSAARPILLIPYLLFLLMIGIIIMAGIIWREQGWPIWGKLYYTLLAFCAGGYVTILAVHGLFFV